MIVSVKLMSWTMDGCLILNKWGWCQRLMHHCNSNCQHVSFVIIFLLPYPNAPLSPSITGARGSNSLRITWHAKKKIEREEGQSVCWLGGIPDLLGVAFQSPKRLIGVRRLRRQQRRWLVCRRVKLGLLSSSRWQRPKAQTVSRCSSWLQWQVCQMFRWKASLLYLPAAKVGGPAVIVMY